MSCDYVNDLKIFRSNKVHIRDKKKVNHLINAIVSGGSNKLQVVSDFDRTLTKQHENGKVHLSSFGIFARVKSLPKSYVEAEQLLHNKYAPLEVDPNIPLDQKKLLIEEWYNSSEKILVGLNVPESEIDDIVKEMGPSLRDGSVDAFNKLNAANVPVLVFSAGLGDAVVAVLKHCNVLLPNVKVVSNFLLRDNEGVIQGFSGKMIHVFNKNEEFIKGSKFFENISNRENVILMGDSLGDVGMADGINTNAVLKIGFLYDHVQGNLPAYMENYDIVLEDDQTMDVLNGLLQIIL